MFTLEKVTYSLNLTYRTSSLIEWYSTLRSCRRTGNLQNFSNWSKSLIAEDNATDAGVSFASISFAQVNKIVKSFGHAEALSSFSKEDHSLRITEGSLWITQLVHTTESLLVNHFLWNLSLRAHLKCWIVNKFCWQRCFISSRCLGCRSKILPGYWRSYCRWNTRLYRYAGNDLGSSVRNLNLGYRWWMTLIAAISSTGAPNGVC